MCAWATNEGGLRSVAEYHGEYPVANTVLVTSSKGNLSKSEGGTFVARSSSSEVRDWEYGLTKVNLVLFLINMATLIAAFTIFFTKDSKPEYTAVLYYTASVFERATES